MLVRCAYGSPLNTASKIPAHSASVEVAVRENAFNPLSSPSAMAQRDERIYVAFQQHIMFQVCPDSVVLPRSPILCTLHLGPFWIRTGAAQTGLPQECPEMIASGNAVSLQYAGKCRHCRQHHGHPLEAS